MRFRFEQKNNWPPLAWLVIIDRNTDAIIKVQHGSQVEVQNDWFCEAVWAGEFGSGDFDRTDLVAGSGGRLRDGRLTLVSSGSTVDRLQSTEHEQRQYISNSLACLLAATGLVFDVAYRYYPDDFYSIVKGIEHYQRDIPCIDGSIHYTYFNNLCWDGQQLTTVAKPGADRRFETFQAYHSFLTDTLSQLHENMAAAPRQTPYTLLGTLSTGYDSTTATALLSEQGLQEVICFEREGNRDSGSALAHYFNVKPVHVDVEAWRSLANPEVPFLAANGIGEEVHYSAAEQTLKNRVLITGYHGDKIWEKNIPYTGSDLVRGDISGMSLMEYRLQVGFIHCPITFFGARQVADLKRIAHQPDMVDWDIGGDYNRPICRRIVEEKGLPRDAFGQLKSYASRWLVTTPEGLTPDSTAQLITWLRSQRSTQLRHGRLPPWCNQKYDQLRLQLLHSLSDKIIKLPGFYRLGLDKNNLFALLCALDMDNIKKPPIFGFRRYFMLWALQLASQRYD